MEKRQVPGEVYTFIHKSGMTDTGVLPACKGMSNDFASWRNRTWISKKFDRECYHTKESVRVVSARCRILKEKIFLKLGNRCNNSECRWINSDGTQCCTDCRCLQIDHVNGGGYQEKRIIRNRLTFLKKVLSDTTGMYQLLCANCNWIKRVEKNEEKNSI